MVLAQMNDPKFHEEINRYRGLSDLQDTLEKLARDAQGRVMEVTRELVVVEGQLNLCKKRLEISNAYEELDRYFHQAMPVPLPPRHSPIRSPLVEAPVTNQGIGPRRSNIEPPCYKGNKRRTRPFGFPTGLGPDGPQEIHAVTL